MISFRLLGLVEIWNDSRRITPGIPRQQTILAALLADAGRVVGTETLITRVWGDNTPKQAVHTLYSHIARIRAIITQAATADDEARLIHRTGGYLIDTQPERVDLHRVRGLLSRADRADCDDRQRVKLLREAVGLWRGKPLTGLTGPWVERMRETWGRLRQETAVSWGRAEIRIGNPGPVIDLLAEMVDEHPLIEPLTEILMRSMAAAGRASEALEQYDRLRRNLAEDLGTDPAADLQTLHRTILRGELDAPPSSLMVVSGPDAPPIVPAQLPPDTATFTGRSEALAQLDTLLSPEPLETTTMEPPPGTTTIAGIFGTAGVGKTTLAVHWAHRVRDHFPDGQLYVDLHGFGSSSMITDPTAAVRRLLDALDVPPQRIPTDHDAQIALYRSLTAGRRMLILFDNARDTAQVRPLLPGAPTCRTVITSRTPLTGLVATEAALPIALGLPSPAEANELLARRLGPDRLAAEPEAVAAIISNCARLPLALAIVAAHAAMRPRLRLWTLVETLQDAQRRWHALTGDDPATDVRTVFSWSYQTLSSTVARLFRLLGLHPGPDVSLAAAASAMGEPSHQVRQWLSELVHSNLLTENQSGRYSLHDLLRCYGADLANSTDPEAERDAALRRILDHYLHSARTSAPLTPWIEDPVPLTAPAPGTVVEDLTDSRGALTWFDAEQTNILAAIDHAGQSWHRHAWHLCHCILGYLSRLGHVDLWHAVGNTALVAARRLDEPLARAFAHHTVAVCATRRGEFAQAKAHYELADQMCPETATPAMLAYAHFRRALLAQLHGRTVDAVEHGRRAVALFRDSHHQRGQALALNNLAWFNINIGDHQKALMRGWQAVSLYERVDQPNEAAAAWDTLGFAYQSLGEHVAALDCYRQARTLANSCGARCPEAEALAHIGDIHHLLGDQANARNAWQEAVDILDDLGYVEAVQVRAKLHELDQDPHAVISPPPTPVDRAPRSVDNL